MRARIRNHLELKRNRDFVKHVFGQFVSAEVRDKIISERNRMVGERKEVAVLFSDVRNFTAYSEENEPIFKAYSYFRDDLLRLGIIRRKVN